MLRHHVKRLLGFQQYEPYNLIEISVANLLHNLRLIEKQNPSQQVIPVLKSNAYGHGLLEVSTVLNANDVKIVAIDGYFEAKTLLDNTKMNILVMGAIRPENVKLLNTKRCSYVVQDIYGLKAFASLNKPVNIHLELNTGMNRLGLSPEEVQPYLDFIKHHPKLKLEGVMSHLADADNPKNDFTAKQLATFEKTIENIQAMGWHLKYIHLAQTAGSTKISSKHVNAIRLGIGLYGINPLSPTDPRFTQLDNLRPVLRLKSALIKVQNLNKGDRVSYNGIFTAPRPMRIGVLPLGYYEGYPRELSNKGAVTHNNETLPVVGRVCMNHIMIDITDSKLGVGSTITLINPDKTAPNSIANIATTHGLFPYQLITCLTEKIKRTVV